MTQLVRQPEAALALRTEVGGLADALTRFGAVLQCLNQFSRPGSGESLGNFEAAAAVAAFPMPPSRRPTKLLVRPEVKRERTRPKC